MNVLTDNRLRALHRAILSGDGDAAAGHARALAGIIPGQIREICVLCEDNRAQPTARLQAIAIQAASVSDSEALPRNDLFAAVRNRPEAE